MDSTLNFEVETALVSLAFKQYAHYYRHSGMNEENKGSLLDLDYSVAWTVDMIGRRSD